ncbi:MAG TPA: zf-HC2 domain-containing protein, partial [Vicinamibacterales bacterium]|nr:zf-HC2 domain-containing protein [Vicinamibacterales bacterium]
MQCREVEEKLASYVDGAANGNAAAIAAHLATCDACRQLAHAQSVARTVLKARAAQLSAIAPPGLRTRIIANTANQPQEPILAWTGR